MTAPWSCLALLALDMVILVLVAGILLVYGFIRALLTTLTATFRVHQPTVVHSGDLFQWEALLSPRYPTIASIQPFKRIPTAPLTCHHRLVPQILHPTHPSALKHTTFPRLSTPPQLSALIPSPKSQQPGPMSLTHALTAMTMVSQMTRSFFVAWPDCGRERSVPSR